MAHHDAVQRLAEVPGLVVDSAQQIIAEVGATAATCPLRPLSLEREAIADGRKSCYSPEPAPESRADSPFKALTRLEPPSGHLAECA